MEIKAPASSAVFLRGFRSDGMWLILSLLMAGGLVLGFGLLAEEVVEGDTAVSIGPCLWPSAAPVIPPTRLAALA
ncbi:hypothetical protein [Mesorhizobium sp. B1-1-8]|uniref:hypothetical protein n=1 Tax=Mesorhizobium sp. B1-1-8 TaxID=2589976 RepID=UPI001D017349|nr:hypothetical protein [Mesorhizobium sp. B1-1-8]UCI10573.1 hypothetical protein FJ974_27735 [Mesorhizobium sp. B1-1-8]